MKTCCCYSQKTYFINQLVICLNPDCNNYLAYTTGKHDLGNWKNRVAVAVLTFFLMFSFDDFSMENTEEYTSSLLMPTHQVILTLDRVKDELKTQNVMCSREVLAQIKIESANLTSSLFKRTNNMFGMRYPFIRQTKASGIYIPALDTVIYGSKNELKKFRKTINYAVYNSWNDAIADYKLWQEKCFNVSDRYLEFIGNIYAEDPLYVKKIRHVAKQSGNN